MLSTRGAGFFAVRTTGDLHVLSTLGAEGTYRHIKVLLSILPVFQPVKPPQQIERSKAPITYSISPSESFPSIPELVQYYLQHWEDFSTRLWGHSRTKLLPYG